MFSLENGDFHGKLGGVNLNFAYNLVSGHQVVGPVVFSKHDNLGGCSVAT